MSRVSKSCATLIASAYSSSATPFRLVGATQYFALLRRAAKQKRRAQDQLKESTVGGLRRRQQLGPGSGGVKLSPLASTSQA